MQGTKRLCLYCGTILHGRADKKFCNDSCRSGYNNHRREEEVDEVKIIQNILKSNRKILNQVLEDGVETVKVKKDRLAEMGFNFKYHTHTLPWKNKEGNTYWFCFDYGYLDIGNRWMLIVRDMGESYLKKLTQTDKSEVNDSKKEGGNKGEKVKV